MRRNRIQYVLLDLFMIYFCIFYSTRTTMLLTILILVYPLISLFFLWIVKRKVSIRLEVEQPQANRYDKNKIRIYVENQSFLPISKVEMKLFYRNRMFEQESEKKIVLSLMGKSTQEIESPFVANQSGEVHFSIRQVRMYDLTKCFRVRKRGVCEEDILILPKITYIADELHNGSQKLFEQESTFLDKPGTDQTELLQVREYKGGDRISRIHWKLTEKWDKIMIREYAKPLYYHPLFLLDVRVIDSEDQVEQMERFFENFFSLALWHVEQQYAFTVAFYHQMQNSNQFVYIQKKEELYELLREIYQNIGHQEESACLKEFYYTKETETYSNVLYFTCNLSTELQMLHELDVYVLYFHKEDLTLDAREQITKFLPEEKFSLVRELEEDSILQAIHNYMIGRRGE